jgi:beta-lactamase superfamily II metal-dependent hydrolase
MAWDRLVAARAAAAVQDRVLRAGDLLPPFATGVAVLHPPRGWPEASLNDGSLVLRVALGGVAFLLTGDVEAGGEGAMQAAGASLRAAVVKVPHHGSRTSSTPRFVDTVAPDVAVVSVGADNRYGLPVADVESRWRAAGACVLRTDRCGAVTVETDGVHVWTTTWRSGCSCPTVREATAPSATPPP